MYHSQVPSLTRVCVSKIVNEIQLFCRGIEFEELGQHSQILGPLDNLCKESLLPVNVIVFDNVATFPLQLLRVFWKYSSM